MNFLRIVFITRSLPFHGLGGMEAIAWDLARAFAAQGHEVAVLTTACPSLVHQQDVDGVRIYCLDVPSGRYSRAWWRQSADFYHTVLRGKFDVVLSVSAGAMALAASRDVTDPALYVVQAHGTAWGEIVSKLSTINLKAWIKALISLKSLIADRGYRRFDAMISAGPRITQDLMRLPTRSIIGELSVHEISNGIDTTKFSFDLAARQRVRDQYGIPKSAPVVLALSRLHAQKGVQYSLRGFAKALARRHDLKFLVVGSGPYEGALRDQVKALNLDTAVIFTGAVDRAQIGAIYAAADVFTFTSTRIEGLPLNILEALASGLPVIVSRHIAIPGQGHQYPIDPQDPDAVGQAMIDAVEREVEASRDCRLAPAFWLSTSVDHYLRLFTSLRDARAKSIIAS